MTPPRSRPRLRALLVAMLWLILPWAAAAQTEAPTSLVADLVQLDGQDRLIAEGNVEVFSGGRRLEADRLVYDRRTDRLEVTGPVRIEQPDGTIVEAEAADVATDFTDGIIDGVRVILNRRLQLAGARATRLEDRFIDIRRAVASSCEVCADGPPLWEIRADRVIHDDEANQVFFYNARFRVIGVPVAYLPVFRLPDGTEDRVRGFIQPSISQSSAFGIGIATPYFIPLGDHADLTLTPYAATGYSRTLRGRYRQLFVNGSLRFDGAISRDSLLPGRWRGYLFGRANYTTPAGYRLNFNLETTSDDPYLRDYDFDDSSRLESGVAIFRARGNTRLDGEVTYYNSLRIDETRARRRPSFVGDLIRDTRIRPGLVGGWLDFGAITHFHRRASDEDVLGRDMAQLRGYANWQRSWVTPGGLRFDADTRLNGDLKRITDDSRFREWQAGLTPQVGGALSWPVARYQGDVSDVITPTAQLVWTPNSPIASPNDDSTEVTFGSGNLFALNRFPGLDRYEEGTRANLGVNWRRTVGQDYAFELTGGRVLRWSDTDQFELGSGLSGRRSYWLTEAQADVGDALNVRSRLLLDDDLAPTLSETRLGAELGRATLASTYLWERQDQDPSYDDAVSELAALASFRATRSWTGRLDFRRDLTGDQFTDATAGVVYANECIRVDLSVRRRFRAVSEDDVTTTYNLGVTLAGFGNNDGGPGPGRCVRGG